MSEKEVRLSDLAAMSEEERNATLAELVESARQPRTPQQAAIRAALFAEDLGDALRRLAAPPGGGSNAVAIGLALPYNWRALTEVELGRALAARGVLAVDALTDEQAGRFDLSDDVPLRPELQHGHADIVRAALRRCATGDAE